MKDSGPIVPKGFDFDYFDNPNACGYQGYGRGAGGDQLVRSWDDIAVFCRARNILSAIDIGCAKGFLVRALRCYGIDAVGYDVSEYALSFTADLPCYQRSVTDDIPDCADAIICLGVLLYIDPELIPSVLESIYRATRRWFFFSSYYLGDDQPVPDPLRRTDATREWWRQVIGAAGFHLRSEEEYFDVYAR